MKIKSPIGVPDIVWEKQKYRVGKAVVYHRWDGTFELSTRKIKNRRSYQTKHKTLGAAIAKGLEWFLGL